MFALFIWMSRAYQMFNTDLEQRSLKELFLNFYDSWLIYIFFFTCFNTIWVTPMTIFHLVNSIYHGVTLNERMNNFRYSYFRNANTGQYVNPFKNQLWKNFLETFGLFRLMVWFRYTRIDWSQIYEVEQIQGYKYL
jgi:hypothetical protein